MYKFPHIDKEGCYYEEKNRILACILSALILGSVLTTPVFAAESDSDTVESGRFSVVTEDPTTTVSPHLSFPGESGYSTLDYMESGRCFAWSIDVRQTSSAYLNFSGEIKITDRTGRVLSVIYHLSGSGMGRTDGVGYITDTLRLVSGTSYTATLTGSATNSEGQTFYVVPGASIPFTYRK